MRAPTLLAGVLLLGGCASMLNGSDETVTVMADRPSACTVTNDKGSYPVTATPATITVHRSAKPLLVACRTLDGRTAQAVAAAEDHTVASFATGGLIGRAIDTDSGAAFDYPNAILVQYR